MMHYRECPSTHLLASLLLAAVLFGVAGSAQAGGGQYLDVDRIDRWLQAMVQVQAYAADATELDGASLQPDFAADTVAFHHALIRAYREHEAVRAASVEHGFSSAREWADTGNLIFQVYSALRRPGQLGAREDAMRGTFEDIRRDPELDEEVRAALLRQMHSVWRNMRQFGHGVDSRDRAAVEQRHSEIAAVFGS